MGVVLTVSVRTPGVEFDLLGWPPDGPRLDLDHERFSYAGKFVMTNTGKAIASERAASTPSGGREESTSSDGGDVVAGASFSADRTDDTCLWIRYVTVRGDRRGQGIAPQLCAFVARRAREHGFEYVRIAVNNPFAYQALYKAGFAYTGEQSGLAELVLERPGDRSREHYQRGLAVFRERDLSDAERGFLRDKADASPPEPVGTPDEQ